MKRLMIVALMLLAACPADDQMDQADASVDTDAAWEEADAMPPPPEQIGDFCLLPACDGENFWQEGGGDDQCEAMTGNVQVCCMADNLCHRGVRFHGPCFPLAPNPAETCPEDGNGNGFCVAGESEWAYQRCDAQE